MARKEKEKGKAKAKAHSSSDEEEDSEVVSRPPANESLKDVLDKTSVSNALLDQLHKMKLDESKPVCKEVLEQALHELAQEEGGVLNMSAGTSSSTLREEDWKKWMIANYKTPFERFCESNMEEEPDYEKYGLYDQPNEDC
ncbi:hypothetical protein CYMTET_10285 [Cymbomonas tetramitiformis]|uniref:Uncharacterized protein n=1 Tax=Cymbomonas tetramitiformis TaxID=36881 RepID=A0AAE0GPQ3_9CHLO|nr:hypothetical protein CYMTET_10285 [Cymbomonas tetramitiformis]